MFFFLLYKVKKIHNEMNKSFENNNKNNIFNEQSMLFYNGRKMKFME
jgi:hypothetical protein